MKSLSQKIYEAIRSPDVLIRTVSSASAAVTCFSVLTIANLNLFFYVTVVVIALLALYSIYRDLSRSINESPEEFSPNSPDISIFVCDFLKQGGRSVIFSRDLSWASNGNHILEALNAKARKKELEVFVSGSNAAIDTLFQNSATIFDYKEAQFNPKARFSIINYGSYDQKIAIGALEDDKFVIRTYDLKKNKTIVALVEDIIALAKIISKKRV
jgi:hypothetical protein